MGAGGRLIFFCSWPEGECSFLSDQKGTEKVATLSMGGRRPGGLTPRSPAEDQQQAFPSGPAPGLTLQAGGYGSPAAGKLAVAFAKSYPSRKVLLTGRLLAAFASSSGHKVWLIGGLLPVPQALSGRQV